MRYLPIEDAFRSGLAPTQLASSVRRTACGPVLGAGSAPGQPVQRVWLRAIDSAAGRRRISLPDVADCVHPTATIGVLGQAVAQYAARGITFERVLIANRTRRAIWRH